MKEGKQKGSFTRCSPYVEMEADRNDCYNEVVTEQVIGSTSLQRKVTHTQSLSLFRANGVVVKDHELQLKGRKLPWTLGNYLLTTKRSHAQTKL